LGSELHRLRHAIKVDSTWISILRCSIPLSATDPRLFHVAMVGGGRGCLAHAPLGEWSGRVACGGNPSRT
jgi:hypothetical protein